MTAQEVFDKGMERMKTFKVESLMPSLKYANEGAKEDVLNTNGCCYYQWSACLTDVIKPKQVIELGGAMGVWSLCILHYLPEDSRLYSITLPEGGLEFSYIKEKHTNFVPVLGTDLDLSLWPKDLDFSKTDLIFFDALHTGEHLQKEVDLYTPLLPKGSIMLFDDIRMSELWPVWDSLPYDKKEITNPCHYSGYGIAIK